MNSNLLFWFSSVALSVLVVLVPQPFYVTHNLTPNSYNYHYSLECVIVISTIIDSLYVDVGYCST